MTQTKANTQPISTLAAWIIDANQTAFLCHADKNFAVATFGLSSGILSLLHHFEYTLLSPKLMHTQDNDTPNVAISLQGLLRIGVIKYSQHNDADYLFNQKSYQLLDYRTLIACLSIYELHNMSHAIQLLRWVYDFRYCNRCGTRTSVHQHEYAQVCPNCAYRNYPRISPCVIVAIYKKENAPKILLAKHHRHSQMYGLIAGFMEVGESCEAAIIREVKEEVGLSVKNIQYISSQPWPYLSNLMLGFLAEYDSGEICIAEDELSCADFFEFDNLPIIPKHGTIARTLIDLVHTKLSQ